MSSLVLASASPIRAALLRDAGLEVVCHPAHIDEEAVRAALQAEGASPRDQADMLAEMKAAKLASRFPDSVVIGCDQVLDLGGTVLSKPETPDAVRAQLTALRGRTHKLLSAVVIYQAGGPVWRHVGEVRLTMRDFSQEYLDSYIIRNSGAVLDSVGGYKLESEGVRLFSQIEGDYFTVLGLPLVALLGYLGQRGIIPA